MKGLCKAKSKDDGEWVEGYYVICRGHHYILPLLDITVENYGFDERYQEWVEIDPETLCQYTGLKDKNGKRIWENDILRGHGNDKDLAKVVFGEFYVVDVETEELVERVVGWHTEVIETDELSKLEPFCFSMPLTDFYIERSEFEVIGNIFDDVALLKGE